MIHIDLNSFRPRTRWLKKAKGHLAQMQKYHLSKKPHLIKKYIKKHQRFWGEIKQDIIKHTVNKCWFSEGINEVAAYHIEHFRPKGALHLINTKYTFPEARTQNLEKGYWWLSFDWRNFRISGATSNSYKGNYFPINAGSFLATEPSHRWRLEEYVLLDPTVKSDVDLLTFNIVGDPVPTYEASVDSYKNIRAVISIDVYGLKDSTLIDSRKTLMTDCDKLIKRIEQYDQDLKAEPTSAVLKRHLYDACYDLKVLTKKEKHFSAMVDSRIKLIPDKRVRDLILNTVV